MTKSTPIAIVSAGSNCVGGTIEILPGPEHAFTQEQFENGDCHAWHAEEAGRILEILDRQLPGGTLEALQHEFARRSLAAVPVASVN